MTAPAPECLALAEGLRQVRARTNLSLAALADRTAYSKSSWERYLNGKKPPPRHAVEELCAIAGEPAGRLLALWELADAEWSGRARHTGLAVSQSQPRSAPMPAGAVDAPGVHGRVMRWWWFVAGAGVVAVAVAATLVAPVVQGHSDRQPTILVSPRLDPPPGCQGKACDGKDPKQALCGLVPGRADTLGAQHRARSGTRVEIRYSPVCAAAWGLIWHSKVGDTIELSAPGARPRRVVIRNTADAGAYRFTPMIGGPDRSRLRLCYTPAGGTGAECFES
ncbi:helix-turn-helix domain-containing protein [Streptomyces sp. NPDC046939]|uniref:helix-turn-helix domain-containing protein n=1 Tax=Streptomyces sp. NPDC046939 TaxID=3155376 RepID=UPI003407229D